MWRVASEAYAYLAGHPYLTDTVFRPVTRISSVGGGANYQACDWGGIINNEKHASASKM